MDLTGRAYSPLFPFTARSATSHAIQGGNVMVGLDAAA
jgi:hypothetical protein